MTFIFSCVLMCVIDKDCIFFWIHFCRGTYLKKCSCVENTEKKYFTAYAITSFVLPILPVAIASMHHMFGIPIYYIKGQHNVDIVTDDFFIFPASCLLFICFCFLIMTLYIFGTLQPKPPKENQGAHAVNEYEEFFKLKQT